MGFEVLRKAGPGDIVRSESRLVRWDAGIAAFRVRLTRGDGVVAEAHGVALEKESEAFWSLAEDRARARAGEVLRELPLAELVESDAGAGLQGAQAAVAAQPPPMTHPAGPVHGIGSAVRPSIPGALPRTGGSGGDPGFRPPVPSNDAPHPRPRPDVAPGPGSTPLVRPAMPRNPGSDTSGPSRDGDSSLRPREAASSLTDGDPFSDEIQFEDEADPEIVPQRPVRPPVAPDQPAAEPAPAENGSSPHIRPETGGVGRTAGPAPEMARCTQQGCGLPLTKAQITVSNRKYGQSLCPRHMREREGSKDS